MPATGEGRAAALAWCGAADGPHWSAPTRGVDFFDVKGVVESVCATFGRGGGVRAGRVAVSRSRPRGRAYGQRDGASVPFGVLGQLMPAIAEARGFPAGEELFVAEIDLEALFALAAGDDLRAESLPRYPSIVRDVSILGRRSLACGHGSWHYPFVSSADAGLDRRVRSLHGKGRSRRAGQPVAAPHLPRCRSHVDRRRGADGDGDDRRRAAARRTAPSNAEALFRFP